MQEYQDQVDIDSIESKHLTSKVTQQPITSEKQQNNEESKAESKQIQENDSILDDINTFNTKLDIAINEKAKESYVSFHKNNKVQSELEPFNAQQETDKVSFDKPLNNLNINKESRKKVKSTSHCSEDSSLREGDKKQSPKMINLSENEKELLLRLNRIDRRKSHLDEPTNYYYSNYQNNKFTTADDNKKQYLCNYGIEFEIPSVYVQDAKIFPSDPSYYLQLVNYAMPNKGEYSYINVKLNGEFILTNQEYEKETNEKQGLVLRLLQRNEHSIKMIDQVFLNSRQAELAFSADGTLFAYYLYNLKQIRVLEVNKDNISNLIQKIRECQKDDSGFKTKFQSDCALDDMSFLNQIKFDQNNRYLIGRGDSTILILDLNTGEGKFHSIEERIYSKIYDINLKSSDYGKYECYIVCQVINMCQLQIFDLVEALEKDKYTDLNSMIKFNFFDPISPNLISAISDDFKQVIIGNGTESLVLQKIDGQIYQRKLCQTKNRIIRYVHYDAESQSFYMLLCKNYDRYLYLENSHRYDMNIKFQKPIEPHIFSIYDMNIHRDELKDGHKQIHMKLLNLMDEEFCQDQVKYDDIQINESNQEKLEKLDTKNNKSAQHSSIKGMDFKYVQENIEYFSNSFTPIRAFSTQWPYVAFSGLNNQILLYDAFSRKYLWKIDVAPADKMIQILESTISENFNLFFVYQEGDQYKLCLIDLITSIGKKEINGRIYKTPCNFKIRVICQYSSDDVQGEQLLQIHVRGSSEKEKIRNHHMKRIIFLRHGNRIYSYVHYTEDQDPKTKLQFVDTLQSDWVIKNQNEIVYMHFDYDENQKIKLQHIKMIEIEYAAYNVTDIYTEHKSGQKMLGFNYDRANDVIIFLLKEVHHTAKGNTKTFKFNIYDPAEDRITYDTIITNKALIGRLKGGLYTFVNGHIYYNNNVIKVRYDLINNNKSNDLYKEFEVFDYYFDIFPLEKDDRVKADTPLPSLLAKRFTYIIHDTSKRNPQRVMVLPYLHDKRIYLNRLKDHTDYFYSSIETQKSDLVKYHKYLIKHLSTAEKNNKQQDHYSLKMSQQVSEYERELSQSVREFDIKKQEEYFTSIICMNISEAKLTVYSQGGVKINIISFKDQEDLYGKVISASNDGRIYLLKKNWQQLKELKKQGYSDQQLKDEFMTIYMLHLSLFEITFVKKINILEGIKSYVNDHQPKHTNHRITLKQLDWVLDNDYQTTVKTLDLKLQQNNNMDVCIRIRNQAEVNECCEKKIKVLYYQEKFSHNKEHHNKLDPEKQFVATHLIELIKSNLSTHHTVCMNLYMTNEKREENFEMNKKYMFMWDQNTIYKHDLSLVLNQENLQKLSLELDPTDKESCIKEIRTGSDPDTIIIILKLNEKVDSIFVWKVGEDLESEAYDIAPGYQVIWDKTGSPYIISNKKVILSGQRCATKAFEFTQEDLILEQQENSNISFHNGHKFDGNSHNWLCLQQYLHMPFSYMTFVILDMIQHEPEQMEELNVFDPVPYNYIFNKSTSFIDGDFIFADHLELQKVLNNFNEQDPDLLELLHYTQNIKESPTDKSSRRYSALHKALDSGNNRSVDLILDSMAKIPYNSSKNFQDILYQLIDFKNFKIYFEELPVQTANMSQKQILRVKNAFSDHIVKQSYSSCIHLDSQYFHDRMGEDVENKEFANFPIKLVGLRLGWILTEEDGQKLLENISNSEDFSLFDIPALKMIVEFLYQNLKKILVIISLPIWIGQLIIFELQREGNQAYSRKFIDNEKQRYAQDFCINNRRAHDFSDEQHIIGIEAKELTQEGSADQQVYNIISLILILLSSLQLGVLVSKLGMLFFQRPYLVLTLCQIVAHLCFTVMIMYKLANIETMTFLELEQLIIWERYIACITMFVLWQKITYFLSLIDGFAPLISMIFQIIADLKIFICIFIIYIYIFSTLFYIIGQNQIDFDCVDDEDITYKDIRGSLYYTIFFIDGMQDDEMFSAGEHSQQGILYLIWGVTVFMILIHLLNMIIAIMAQSFDARNEIIVQTTTRQHLNFVVDNWVMMQLAFKDRYKIKYIITAFISEEESGEVSKLNELKTGIDQMYNKMLQNFDQMKDFMIEVKGNTTKIGDDLNTYAKRK